VYNNFFLTLIRDSDNGYINNKRAFQKVYHLGNPSKTPSYETGKSHPDSERAAFSFSKGTLKDSN
jgi:hypothetical protein